MPEELKVLDPYIGDLLLESIHGATLKTFVKERKDKGIKSRTINHGLKIVRRILNLAEEEWVDEFGLSWLLSAPKIKLLPEKDLRKPYPINWEEQERLFRVLPDHLREMALFAVNTGCRDREVCRLRWQWEVKVPEIDSSVFIIPGDRVKNEEDRLVVLNKIAHDVIEKQRGNHPDFVFVFRGKPNVRMLSTGWRQARKKVGLRGVRVHDLKHTYGHEFVKIVEIQHKYIQ